MNLEDHPAFDRCRRIHGWVPLFVFKEHLFTGTGASTPSLVVLGPDGTYAGTIFPVEPQARVVAEWYTKTFSPQDQETIWALASLHR